MAKRERNRGPDPKDADAFGAPAIPALRTACAELSWLLERGYAMTGALALVGNRHQLTSRQRDAVERAACGETRAAARRHARLPGGAEGTTALQGRTVVVDGFNVIIVTESLLGGAPAFRGRDGALRDLAGVGGTWRRVARTAEALERLADVLGFADCVEWILDAPVSNSGRLAAMLREVGETHAAAWSVETVPCADPRVLERAEEVGESALIATADAQLLDAVSVPFTDRDDGARAARWVDLPSCVAASLAMPWVVDLGPVEGAPGGGTE